MAKYFFDIEFIEGFHKPLFGKRRHFIDLISIGIVCEDGREYAAISNEYHYNDADDWVKRNVIGPLYIATVHGDERNRVDADNFQFYYGKTNQQIAKEIEEFVNPYKKIFYSNDGSKQMDWSFHNIKDVAEKIPGDAIDSMIANMPIWAAHPEFYAYYADYDWVVFCSLFGRMIELPKGFPMYCRDLKQMLDEKAQSVVKNYNDEWKNANLPSSLNEEVALKWLKGLKYYPHQQNEHLAIDNARWNKELYYFIVNKHF